MKESIASILNCWQAIMTETLLRSVLLLVVSAGALVLFRRASASARVLILRLALAGMLVLPIASILLPPWQVNLTLPAPASGAGGRKTALTSRPGDSYLQAPVRSATDDSQPDAGQSSVKTASARTSNRTAPAPANAGTLSLTPPVSVPMPLSGSSATGPLRWKILLLPMLFVVWALGMCMSLLRLAASALALRKLTAKAKPAAQEISALAERLARTSGVRGSLRVLQGESSDAGLPPITWGWHRPVIWLPDGAETWPLERVRAVLLHEIAHIVRCDWLIQCVANIISAFWWFHPGVWLLCQALRRENERACDDCALSYGLRPCEYAAHLLETTKMTTRKRSLSAAVSMAQPSLLESRLRSILDVKRARNPLPRRVATVLLAAAGLCLIPLASLRVSASHAASRAVGTTAVSQIPAAMPAKHQGPIVARYTTEASQYPTSTARNFTLNLSSILPGNELTLVQSNVRGPGAPKTSRPSARAIGFPPLPKPAQPASATANELENPKMDSAGIVWGEVSDGLQAGVRLTGKSERIAIGEHLSAECYIRNTTQHDIAFAIADDISFYDQDSPTIYPANGVRKAERQETVRYDLSHGKIARITLVLKPGETLVLENPGVNIGDVRGRRLGATEGNDLTPFPYLADPMPGHYRLRQKFRYALTTPDAFEQLYTESKKHDYTRERTVRTPAGEVYKTRATLSDIGELPAALLTGAAGFVVITRPPASQPAAPVKDPAALVWGKPRSGLEGALRFKENRRYFDGERLEWDYLVRNVSNQTISFTHEPSQGVSDTIPEIVGSDGKKYHAMGWVVLHTSEQRKVTLQPGEIAVVGHPRLGINREDTMLSATLHDTGRYTLSQYFHFWTAEKGSQDLMSGPAEFVLAGNEDNAAWGTSINGLQAGLSFHGPQSRFKTGETIGMDFFVRNTGKRPIRFAYHPRPQFNGVLPIVTDLTGKPADLLALPQGPYTTGHTTLTLQPGEMVVLGRQKLGLQSDDKLNESITLRNGPGKYKVRQSIQLDLQTGNSEITTLASGQLEFETVTK